jgi:hypothetical protein
LFIFDFLGLLFKSNWDTTKFCGSLEQFRLCIPCSGRDMAGNTSLWEGICLQ